MTDGTPTETAHELENFARELAAEQQPLGEDFARVLEENLWKLYVIGDTD